ncbi:MAG: hypothetical protein GXY58_02310 [Planctomycetaceae bacterium]|nr:hypothetical protein [Planctomycetaceae bacterium]
MSDQEFICGSAADDDDLRAYDEGLLVAWRRGPDGTQWYRRAAAGDGYPEIRAVPADQDLSAEDEPVVLTDAERDALLQWADGLRHAGDDSEGDDDDPE